MLDMRTMTCTYTSNKKKLNYWEDYETNFNTLKISQTALPQRLKTKAVTRWLKYNQDSEVVMFPAFVGVEGKTPNSTRWNRNQSAVTFKVCRSLYTFWVAGTKNVGTRTCPDSGDEETMSTMFRWHYTQIDKKKTWTSRLSSCASYSSTSHPGQKAMETVIAKKYRATDESIAGCRMTRFSTFSSVAGKIYQGIDYFIFPIFCLAAIFGSPSVKAIVTGSGHRWKASKYFAVDNGYRETPYTISGDRKRP